MKLGSNHSEVLVRQATGLIELTSRYCFLSLSVYLTNSEALELAAELVKLAMPDAKPDTQTVSIM